ncbi:MAG TPA: glycosyltransferase [Gemmatimonadaceae bacterium]|nr:glycosyltransferase [Gemmatimonadaceae bacterium]
MRIAMILSDFPTLSETFILGQITGLLDRGHDVDIYAEHRGSGTKIHPDVHRYRLLQRARWQPEIPDNLLERAVRGAGLFVQLAARDPRRALAAVNVRRNGRSARSGRLIFMATPFAGRAPYDAVLCHFGPMGRKGVAMRDWGLVRGKVATVFHGFDVSSILAEEGSEAYAWLFERGDLFLPVSDYWRSRLVAVGAPPERTVVHRMGIDGARFDFKIRALSDGDATVRCISIARLIEKKGIEYAIRAVAALRAQGLQVEYRVIGEGPLQAELEGLIVELGAGSYVHLLGSRTQDAVRAELMASHIFLAPSVTAANGDMEGIPVSLMEAMATGMPVISTRHSGIPELVEDGVSGFLVPERDVPALSDILAHLARNRVRWRELAHRAREAVLRDFDAAHQCDRLVELLGGPAARDEEHEVPMTVVDERGLRAVGRREEEHDAEQVSESVGP